MHVLNKYQETSAQFVLRITETKCNVCFLADVIDNKKGKILCWKLWWTYVGRQFDFMYGSIVKFSDFVVLFVDF